MADVEQRPLATTAARGQSNETVLGADLDRKQLAAWRERIRARPQIFLRQRQRRQPAENQGPWVLRADLLDDERVQVVGNAAADACAKQAAQAGTPSEM